MKSSPAIFIDTSAWAAFVYEKDEWHSSIARTIGHAMDRYYQVVTSNFVIDETITLLLKFITKDKIIEFVENLNESSVKIVEVNRELWNLAWGIFKQYRDKQFSFTDCTSFAIMREMGIEEAISLDRHFDQMGFMRIF